MPWEYIATVIPVASHPSAIKSAFDMYYALIFAWVCLSINPLRVGSSFSGDES